MENPESKVKEIIIDKLLEESEVTNEASFANDLGADSLDTVELIMEFEKEFNISIPDQDAEKIGTVGEAVKYILKIQVIFLNEKQKSCSYWHGCYYSNWKNIRILARIN